jgi:hypothetical protein
MNSGNVSARRRAARAILLVGALSQLLLILALPLFSMGWDEWRSFLLLLVLLLISLGSAVALRKWSRQAVIALTFGSAYAALLSGWTAVVTLQQIWSVHPSPKPTDYLSLAFALGTFVTLPIALAFAWPLRGITTGNESAMR